MEAARNREIETGAYMTIGQIARRAGVTPHTIRYYEQIGIMAAQDRAPNGFRKYSDRDLYALRLVRRAKLLGLSLAEIKEMAPTLWEDPTEKKLIEKSIEVFTKHREKTEEKIKELEDYRALLTKEIARLKGLL